MMEQRDTTQPARSRYCRQVGIPKQPAVSVQAPALEAIADKLGVGGLKARPAELELESIGSRVEDRNVLCAQPPAEGAGVILHLQNRRCSRDRDGAFADDPENGGRKGQPMSVTSKGSREFTGLRSSILVPFYGHAYQFSET